MVYYYVIDTHDYRDITSSTDTTTGGDDTTKTPSKTTRTEKDKIALDVVDKCKASCGLVIFGWYSFCTINDVESEYQTEE